MKVNHIGYAVRRMDKAISDFEEIGFRFDPMIEDAERNVRLVFGNNDEYRIELVMPLDTSVESPVDQYIKNAYGMPYHFCFESENFEEDIMKLEQCGYKMVVPPSPAVAFNGKRVAFLVSRGVGLIEILENNY